MDQFEFTPEGDGGDAEYALKNSRFYIQVAPYLAKPYMINEDRLATEGCVRYHGGYTTLAAAKQVVLKMHSQAKTV